MRPSTRLHVIIPFYNAGHWIDRCLRSIRSQYSEMERPLVQVIDDASTDGSGELAKELCEEFHFKYIRNLTNQKCPQNIFQAVQHSEARPWDVIFLVDGDDYLPHQKVLFRVGQLFAEASTWLTYGQYMSDPPDYGCAPALPPPENTIRHRTYRKTSASQQFFNHPLIFRRFLFDAIPVFELQDNDGDWFTTGYDRTIMIPMLELASGEIQHWKFINEILYVYNSGNSSSEVKVPELQQATQVVDQIYDRPVLPPLELTAKQRRAWFGTANLQ